LDKEKMIYHTGNYAALTRDAKYTEDKNKEVSLINNLGFIEYFPDGKYQTMILDLKLFDGSGKIILKDLETGNQVQTLFLEEGKIEQVEVNVTNIIGKGIRLTMEAENYSKGTALVVLPTSHYK
jgi:hypothetical protein